VEKIGRCRNLAVVEAAAASFDKLRMRLTLLSLLEDARKVTASLSFLIPSLSRDEARETDMQPILKIGCAKSSQRLRRGRASRRALRALLSMRRA
jgi:hypothetical protein